MRFLWETNDLLTRVATGVQKLTWSGCVVHFAGREGCRQHTCDFRNRQWFLILFQLVQKHQGHSLSLLQTVLGFRDLLFSLVDMAPVTSHCFKEEDQSLKHGLKVPVWSGPTHVSHLMSSHVPCPVRLPSCLLLDRWTHHIPFCHRTFAPAVLAA